MQHRIDPNLKLFAEPSTVHASAGDAVTSRLSRDSLMDVLYITDLRLQLIWKNS